MPSAFAHAVVAPALGSALPASTLPRRWWMLGVVCSVVPDLDSLAVRLGVPYSHPFGHRGFLHGLFFAACLAGLAAAVLSGRGSDRRRAGWLTAYLFVVTALHGLLDAMTNGGLGVAVLSPFTNRRFFAPFRPIAVSPLSPRAFFTQQGVLVLGNELLWIGVPCLVFALAAHLVRRRSARRSMPPDGPDRAVPPRA